MVLALEKKYSNKINFIVVDIDDPQGQVLAKQFDIYYIPEFSANAVPESAITLAIESPITHLFLFILFPPFK